MAIKNIRVERVVTTGLMATKDELMATIEATKNGALFSYELEAPVIIRGIAGRAQTFGRLACGSEGCQLSCAGIDLRDTITPESNIDADFTARCTTPDCTDKGPQTTLLYLQDALHLL